MTDLVSRAHAFARDAHAAVGQMRKYTTDVPYIVHPEAVAEIVRSVPHTEAMLAAAYLHDTVEDTEVTIQQITEAFGPEVADLVGWLTDISLPQDGNRAIRKEIDRQHTAQAPAAAKTIKLADLLDNTQSIVANGKGFAHIYLREKALLLEVLTEGDPTLLARAQASLAASLALLNRQEE